MIGILCPVTTWTHDKKIGILAPLANKGAVGHHVRLPFSGGSGLTDESPGHRRGQACCSHKRQECPGPPESPHQPPTSSQQAPTKYDWRQASRRPHHESSYPKKGGRYARQSQLLISVPSRLALLLSTGGRDATFYSLQ